jgi:hypothetical protein
MSSCDIFITLHVHREEVKQNCRMQQDISVCKHLGPQDPLLQTDNKINVHVPTACMYIYILFQYFGVVT